MVEVAAAAVPTKVGLRAMADGFLGRWSRRKQDVRVGKPVEDPPVVAVQAPLPTLVPESPSGVAVQSATRNAGSAPPTAACAADAAPPPLAVAQPAPALPDLPTLADAEALTPASDFQPFVSRAVSPEVRNLAMKKLFADPHFNVMDGLDIYIGDYTQPDPMPAGMLRKMASAHALGFFDHEKKAADGTPLPGDLPNGAPDERAAIAPAVDLHEDDAEADSPQDVAQSQVCNAIPSDSLSEPLSPPDPVIPCASEGVMGPASHTDHDHDAHLRLQPDDAPQRESAGRGAA